jgi:hypothetical protein
MAYKFDDCKDCRFRRKPHICADCDVGELYEEQSEMTVDERFSEPNSIDRYSVTDDELTRFDANRFIDALQDEDDDDDSDA